MNACKSFVHDWMLLRQCPQIPDFLKDMEGVEMYMQNMIDSIEATGTNSNVAPGSLR